MARTSPGAYYDRLASAHASPLPVAPDTRNARVADYVRTTQRGSTRAEVVAHQSPNTERASGLGSEEPSSTNRDAEDGGAC